MAILKFLGASIYGIVASYLIWLLFYFITPWVMSFGWGGVIVSVIAGSLLVGAFLSICALVLSPMMGMIDNTVSKIIPTLAILFYGYSSVKLPWGLELDYTLPKIILAITISGVALTVFFSALQVVWTSNSKN